MTRRLVALPVALALAVFPAGALADEAAPGPEQPAPEQPAPEQPAPEQTQAQQPAPEQPPAEPACLSARGGGVDDLSIRGVRVGARANLRDADGRPLDATSVTYCVQGGGEFSFSLSKNQDVVLIVSTAGGDSIGRIKPTAPARSARAEFPKMKKITRSARTSIYRVDGRRQLLLGVTGGRVSFVAAADRLLLEYPGKLGYHLRRLGV